MAENTVGAQAPTLDQTLASVAGMTTEERNRRLDAGEFDSIAYSKDPEVKKRFSAAFTGKQNSDAAVVPPAKSEETVVAPADSKPKTEDKSAVPPAGTAADDWAGYGSKEEMLKAFDEARKLNVKRKREIDQQNTDKGKLGREAKELRERLEKEAKEKEALRKQLLEREEREAKEKEGAITVSEPSDDVRAALGDDWVGNDLKIKKNLLENNTLTQKHNREQAERINRLEQSIREREERDKQDMEEREIRRQRDANESYDKSMQTLYTDVEDLQKNAPELKMTRSFGELNKEVLDNRLPDGTVDPEFIKTIPPAELKVFNTIAGLINNGYGTFETDGFKRNPVFKNLRQRYLIHLDETGELEKKIAERSLAQERAAADQIKASLSVKQQSAITLPDHKSGGMDGAMIVSQGDKVERIRVLIDKSSQNTTTAEEEAELDRLLGETGQGGAVPKPKPMRS